MFANGRIWLAYLIVFVSSTCGLVIEMVAGRILAPYIGVSLYTWTSIIGIVLAGISVGNYLGGVVADRRASRETLGAIFVAGGLASAGILAMTAIVTGVNLAIALVPKIVLFTTAIFFLPSLILGMVSPIVIKLALPSMQRAGNTVGSIYAFSTVGSIFGTFITGFWLISWFGTRAIIWAVALILLAMGAVIGELWRPFGRAAALSGALLSLTAALWANNSGAFVWLPRGWAGWEFLSLSGGVALVLPALLVLITVFARQAGGAAVGLCVLAFGLMFAGWDAGIYRAPCEVESNYFCIRTSEATTDGKPVRALVLDHLVHSYVALDDPKVLGYGYERVYAEVTTYHKANHKDLDTLFIGGGGYTFPKYVEAMYPESSVDVMEIDPAVTEAAHTFLNLPRDTRIRSFNQDARAFLLEWQEQKQYDIVYGDAFNDLSVPYHLTTVEFDRLLAARMKDDGIYMANVIDKYEGGEFVKAFMNALKQVFPNVYLLAQGEAWNINSSNTYIVLASRQPFDYAKFAATVAPGGQPLTRLLPPDRLAAYLQSGRALTLTDDFVPVDQLVAPLFVDRGL
ncbi:MAG: fused MFS/spermidine synthase [Chloroflexota bacterium]